MLRDSGWQGLDRNGPGRRKQPNPARLATNKTPALSFPPPPPPPPLTLDPPLPLAPAKPAKNKGAEHGLFAMSKTRLGASCFPA